MLFKCRFSGQQRAADDKTTLCTNSEDPMASLLADDCANDGEDLVDYYGLQDIGKETLNPKKLTIKSPKGHLRKLQFVNDQEDTGRRRGTKQRRKKKSGKVDDEITIASSGDEEGPVKARTRKAKCKKPEDDEEEYVPLFVLGKKRKPTLSKQSDIQVNQRAGIKKHTGGGIQAVADSFDANQPSSSSSQEHDAMNSYYCASCKQRVFYVNAGGWREHFKKKHGGRGRLKSIAGSVIYRCTKNEFGENVEVPVLEAVTDDEDESKGNVLVGDEELMINELFQCSSEIANDDDDNGQSEMNRAAMRDKEVSKQGEISHRCGALKKIVWFVSAEAFQRHLEKYQCNDMTHLTRDDPSAKLVLHQDGSVGFSRVLQEGELPESEAATMDREVIISSGNQYTVNQYKISHVCGARKKAVIFSTQEAFQRHLDKCHEGEKPVSDRATKHLCHSDPITHNCDTFQKVMSFLSQEAFARHLEKYHVDEKSSINDPTKLDEQDEINHTCDTFQKVMSFLSQEAFERHLDTYHVDEKSSVSDPTKLAKEIKSSSEQDEINHNCSTLQKLISFLSQEAFQRHLEKYHLGDDEPGDGATKMVLHGDGSVSFRQIADEGELPSKTPALQSDPQSKVTDDDGVVVEHLLDDCAEIEQDHRNDEKDEKSGLNQHDKNAEVDDEEEHPCGDGVEEVESSPGNDDQVGGNTTESKRDEIEDESSKHAVQKPPGITKDMNMNICAKCKKPLRRGYNHACEHEINHNCSLLNKMISFSSPVAFTMHMEQFHKNEDVRTSVTIQKDKKKGNKKKIPPRGDTKKEKLPYVPDEGLQESTGAARKRKAPSKALPMSTGATSGNQGDASKFKVVGATMTQLDTKETASNGRLGKRYLLSVSDSTTQGWQESTSKCDEEDVLSSRKCPKTSSLGHGSISSVKHTTGRFKTKSSNSSGTGFRAVKRAKKDLLRLQNVSPRLHNYDYDHDVYTCGLCQKEFVGINTMYRHKRVCIEFYIHRICHVCRERYSCAKTYNDHPCVVDEGAWRKRREVRCWKVCVACDVRFDNIITAYKHVVVCPKYKRDCQQVQDGSADDVIDREGVQSTNGVDRASNPDYRVHWLLKKKGVSFANSS